MDIAREISTDIFYIVIHWLPSHAETAVKCVRKHSHDLILPESHSYALYCAQLWPKIVNYVSSKSCLVYINIAGLQGVPKNFPSEFSVSVEIH